MKNLLLIRHAKSSWDDLSLSDRERPLNKRGKRDAPAMGLLLKEKGLLPDLIFSSPAKRALKTAKIIAEEVGYPKNHIEVRESIYGQGLDSLLGLIGSIDDGMESVFLIGHNPELTELANRLSNANIANVPTCGIVSIEFAAAHWNDCVPAIGKLAFFERPVKSKDKPSLDTDIIGT